MPDQDVWGMMRIYWPKFLCTLIEYIRTLFEHRSIIAELRVQLVQQSLHQNPPKKGDLSQSVGGSPLASKRASKDNAPVRFKRSSYAEAMSTWEYEHNTKLKTELEKRRGGFY